MLILGFPDSRAQARALAKRLDQPYGDTGLHHFPDGESRVTLPEEINEHKQLIILRSLDHPNDKLVELLFTCQAARARGVEHITLIAPYLCYMRQDTAFHPGEIVSQQVFGRWLSGLVDRLVTVDPHLHRVESLDEVFPDIDNRCVSAMPLMAEFLKKRPSPPLLLGPDEESQQWVQQLADHAGLDWCVAKKERHSDYHVVVTLPDVDVRDRHVVIVDDVASTGRTISQAATQLRHAGATSIGCMIVHALFADDQEQALGVIESHLLWSTDSIPHTSNTISLTELLAETVSR